MPLQDLKLIHKLFMAPYSWGGDDSSTWEGGSFDYGDKKKSYSTEDLKESNMDITYATAAKVIRTVLATEELELLNQLEKDDIVVLPGGYDFVENILKDAEIPHTLVNKSKTLKTKQILLINCPGKQHSKLKYKQSSGKAGIKQFVSDGGFLVSTDWTLDSVIPTFPEIIVHAGKDTGHDVVEIDLVAEGSPYTRGLGSGSLKPLWWLESSSYPVKIINKDEVDILLGSKEMKQKYGEMPIAVKFKYNKGRVIHVVSHFYLKYFKSKYKRQVTKTGIDFVKVFFNLPDKAIKQIKDIDKVSFGQLEAAYTSVRFLFNIFLEKLKKNKQDFSNNF